MLSRSLLGRISPMAIIFVVVVGLISALSVEAVGQAFRTGTQIAVDGAVELQSRISYQIRSTVSFLIDAQAELRVKIRNSVLGAPDKLSPSGGRETPSFVRTIQFRSELFANWLRALLRDLTTRAPAGP